METPRELKTYRASFTGRKNGDLGISYRHDLLVQGYDEKSALVNLYKTHEHILLFSLTEAQSHEGGTK